MQPVDSIKQAAWMNEGATRQVVSALSDGGAEVRFVGGCVRDSLLGRPVRDVDIATDRAPEDVMAILERAGLKVVPTGLQHGTVTAVAEGRPFEITTLREDVETFGRHATVAFTDDWEADAARRDFTFNALSLTPEGALYDPFGGRADLEAGIVRFVGDAGQRIREDYLRILRFFRFLAHYGKQAPDAATLKVIDRELDGLDRLSGERVRDELFKLLAAPDPMPSLRLMQNHGVLDRLLPEAEGLTVLERLLGLAAAGDPVLLLAALLSRERTAAAGVARRLRLSNHEEQHLLDLVAPPAELRFPVDPRGLRRLCYRLGKDRASAAVLLAAARSDCKDNELAEALAVIADWDPTTRFPLAGQDLLDQGLEPGPEIGRLLKAVEDWWVGQDFAPDREACLSQAKKRLSEPRV